MQQWPEAGLLHMATLTAPSLNIRIVNLPGMYSMSKTSKPELNP